MSRQTAVLALSALGVAWSRAQVNGRAMPAYWERALDELTAAARAVDGTEGDGSAPRLARSEWIDTATAAERLGLAERTVRARLAKGRLSGHRVGRVWVVEWQKEAEWQVRIGSSRPM